MDNQGMRQDNNCDEDLPVDGRNGGALPTRLGVVSKVGWWSSFVASLQEFGGREQSFYGLRLFLSRRLDVELSFTITTNLHPSPSAKQALLMQGRAEVDMSPTSVLGTRFSETP